MEKEMATHSILAWEFQGQRSPEGFSPQGLKKSDTTEQQTHIQNIKLSEGRHTHLIPFIWNTHKSKPYKTESSLLDWGWRWESSLTTYRWTGGIFGVMECSKSGLYWWLPNYESLKITQLCTSQWVKLMVCQLYFNKVFLLILMEILP